MRRTAVLMMAGMLAPAVLADESVVNSPHDLSVRGPGPVQAVRQSEVCIFCHTPHNAMPQTPLWNHRMSNTHYRIYQSSTLKARVDQPTGPSKMCLSCHDGSLALGAVLSEPESHPLETTPQFMPPGPLDLTTDLSDDHPIGFRYDRALASADPQIRVPDLISRELPLGSHKEMHCTTCHDPHNDSLGRFLRITDRFAAICVTCHDLRGWQGSSHMLATARIRGRDVDPREELKYHTVAENACLNCHKIHSAPQRQRLLRFREEERNCLNCHSGTVAKTNILADIGKRSAHYVSLTTGIHDAAEDPITMRRHVECVDCHNPHAVRPDLATRRRGTNGVLVPLQNLFVPGVNAEGIRLETATYLYEICFRCHADNPSRRRSLITREVRETNLRLEFQSGNPSYHPVTFPRNNREVVSLMPPLRQGSMITCIDCHNSNNARSVGGNGPNGPHGSIFKPLLVANYETRDFTTESQEAYALCYRCHDRNSILGNRSFALHQMHIVKVQAPCAACHAPHGVNRFETRGGDHTHLINFNLGIVRPVDFPAPQRIEYRDTGQLQGNCTLKCHNQNHIAFRYSQQFTN